MIEYLKELVYHSYLGTLLTLFIACYILRDVVRAMIYIFDSSRRTHRRNKSKKREQHE